METNDDISAELASISKLVAGIGKKNVFTVPEGYFDSISTTVLACLAEENSLARHSPGTSGWAVPEGYFDLLAGSILDKIKSAGDPAAEETWELSPLLYSLRSMNVFEVPAGYFEQLPGDLCEKIGLDADQESIEELSPLLRSIREKNIFDVPAGYFASLPEKILSRVIPARAKLVHLGKRTLLKYAAAAMITGLTALAVYKFTGGINNEIGNGKNVSVVTLDASIEKGKAMNEEQFNNALAKLNGADIAKYLEANGDITDIASLNNNVDDSDLPNQDDYLLDGAALDNYLKAIENATINN